MMVNWEFIDDQTPQSALELVESLQAVQSGHSTRGPRICTWKEAARVLAGFPRRAGARRRPGGAREPGRARPRARAGLDGPGA